MKTARLVVAALALALACSCGDDKSNDAQHCAPISGRWDVALKSQTAGCGGDLNTSDVDLQAPDDGCLIMSQSYDACVFMQRQSCEGDVTTTLVLTLNAAGTKATGTVTVEGASVCDFQATAEKR